MTMRTPLNRPRTGSVAALAAILISAPLAACATQQQPPVELLAIRPDVTERSLLPPAAIARAFEPSAAQVWTQSMPSVERCFTLRLIPAEEVDRQTLALVQPELHLNPTIRKFPSPGGACP